MEDEWTSVISGDRLVKFTYVDIPGGEAFLTAQIAGHAVVYSVILRQAEHPFTRAGVERHFNDECPPISH
jgi:translation initiation factor 2 gamma subunit (eIF-2gamma)